MDQPTKPNSPARPLKTASPVLVWTAILILYVVWGSTYLAIRVAVESLPPFVMGAIRFAIAGLVMIGAVMIATRGRVARPSFRELRDCAIVGTCLMFGGMGLVSWGEQTVPSGIAGVLIAMMPVWVAVYGRVLFAERLPGLAVLGIGTALVGVVGLVAQGIAVDRSLDPVGVGAIVLSPMLWAAGTTFAAHRASLPSNPFFATGLEMLSGSVVLAIAAVATGELAAFQPASVTVDSIAATGYLTVVGSLVAFTAFVWVIRHAPLPLVTTYAFVNPVIAVFLGWLLLHETVGPVQLAAGAVIVAGVALIILARSRMTEAPASEPRHRHEHEDVPATA
ncbi:MAG TPA: EamA family transporter [Candidatus Limnocylindrales bacterium]|nr:EamA family transporter [Candidatus Limnocylindrales bacterium]